ncbi:MAG TPA: type I-U CRISPR-associated protein Csb2 [Candidatus Didemnitutus sp.]|jgi:CRISPR-associated protein Csb2
MTVLELRFPAGRYHATPWGRHVNEGAIEWPPSPWRIVRALVATWHLKAREIPEATVHGLVDALSEPPSFRLPRATTAHTRHYMPYNEGKNEKTTKVFDTFIQVSERDPMLIAWDVVLSPEQFAALRTLAERLGYFGRAESLVEARVREGITAIEPNSTPLPGAAAPPEKTELVRVLAPMTPAAYGTWHEEFLASNTPAPDGKKKPGKKTKAPDVPSDLFAALHANTGELQSAGWNLPPGATFVNYTRREDAFVTATRPLSRRRSLPPTAARYAVVSAVAPRITQAISVAGRVHDALCKWSDQGKGSATVFAGLDENGKPRTDHKHAHIFCEANGPRDAITHITVWAPMGFDEAACLALRHLNKVWGHGGHDIRLVLHGVGQPGEFEGSPFLGAAKIWRSLTPFVSTRHAKSFRDGRPKIDPDGWQEGSAGHDLLRLLAQHPNGFGAVIKQLDERKAPFQFGENGERRLRSLQFQTIRHGGNGRRGHQSGAAFTITFPEPRQGPFAFGYAAHFGLGLFVPVD